MVLKTVIKVQICNKDKKKIFKSVSTLEGVNKIEIDVAKGTLTVIGDADPCKIILKARKIVKCAEVMTIGPPPPPEKKPDPPKTSVCGCPSINMPPYPCQPLAMVHMNPSEPYCTTCTIM
ncbi:heavy metal-associated isoprenylated plant protein 43-like [Cynara cardunculus var. scolymus]|uniref:heavy metal-associated isoprenylated plant protein 43-like n=1 Tax=Cynara cardunculus var. scolymus TaxID=59895 RepID=UPI000D62DC1A|nr:heavy metal-associated isoprenylated plant protein 43-like [Cynara cardunculus var. scolymus]